MVIRTSSSTVFLNGRFIAFANGDSARDVFARLAKHAPLTRATTAPKPTPRKASKGEGMPAHPLEAIAQSVAWRLANPTNRAFLNRKIARAKGSNAHRVKVKNDGHLRGFTQRALSETDIEEIRGVVSLVFAELGNPDRLDLAAWKRIFSESRAVLGMKRKVARENLLDSLDGIDFHSELILDGALISRLDVEREEAEEMERAKRCSIARTARTLRAKLQAARRGDLSRRARANYRTAARYLRKAIQAALGMGHNYETRFQAYRQHATFCEYIAEGEAQLSKERDAESAQLEAEESVRLLFAVAE